MPARVFDMDFDEVSTVDVPANQHGLFVLAKRADQEASVPDYFDVDGEPIDDINTLEVGELFQDADGQAYQVQEDDGGDDLDLYDGADERELETVGKSAFFEDLSKREDAVFATLSDELSKAATDEDREAVLAKAFSIQATELSKAQAQAAEAYGIAKAAQDRELEKSYIEKAAEYTLPIAPDELGPVLKRMVETMSFDDCAVIAKCLNSSSEILKQLGVSGEADDDDPFEQIERHANERAGEIGKSADGREALSKEAATVSYLDHNPAAYAAMRRDARRG